MLWLYVHVPRVLAVQRQFSITVLLISLKQRTCAATYGMHVRLIWTLSNEYWQQLQQQKQQTDQHIVRKNGNMKILKWKNKRNITCLLIMWGASWTVAMGTKLASL